MVDFSNLSRHKPAPGATAEYVFDTLEGDPPPTLIVRPATEDGNPAYFHALLRELGKGGRRSLRRGAITDAAVKRNRAIDQRLYSAHVVDGWHHVVDVDGNLVDFSKDNCTVFLKQLPNELFDDLRDFCSSSANFTPDILDEGDVEGRIKNS